MIISDGWRIEATDICFPKVVGVQYVLISATPETPSHSKEQFESIDLTVPNRLSSTVVLQTTESPEHARNSMLIGILRKDRTHFT